MYPQQVERALNYNTHSCLCPAGNSQSLVFYNIFNLILGTPFPHSQLTLNIYKQ